VLVKAGLAARQQGQLDECERLCEDAMAEAERTGDILARGQAMTNLRSALWHKGQVARARALGQQAVSLLEAAPPGVELADARLCAAEDATLSGDLATALEQAQIGLALAHDLGADDQAVTALIIRGATRCLLGDLDGMEDLRAAHEQALHLGLGITAAYAHGWLSEWTWLAVGSLPARRLYDQLVEFAEARGMADWALSASSEVLRVRFDLGDWDELLAACDDVMQRCAAGNAVQYEVFALLTKGQVLVFRGELALATTVHDRVVPLARDLGDLQVLVPALAMSSILAFRQGEDARATSAAAELAELTRGNRWRAHHLPAMVRHLVAAGHTAMAQDLMIGVEFSAARDRHSALAARAVLAEARGEHHEALAVYADAAQRWAEFGSVLEEGYALLGQGRCLWAMGAPEAAEDHTVRAGELLGRLGVPVVTDGRDPGAQPAQRPA
jgi:tetratricopeptide (TPR) repeat protein